METTVAVQLLGFASGGEIPAITVDGKSEDKYVTDELSPEVYVNV